MNHVIGSLSLIAKVSETMLAFRTFHSTTPSGQEPRFTLFPVFVKDHVSQ